MNEWMVIVEVELERQWWCNMNDYYYSIKAVQTRQGNLYVLKEF